VHAHAACGADDAPEMRVQLRRAAGDVERSDPPPFKERQNGIGGLAAHLLGAMRARADMAMHAGLVAAVADIDLQRVEPSAANRREGYLLEPRQTLVHAANLAEAGGGVTVRPRKWL
jgi:hypothetical protein